MLLEEYSRWLSQEPPWTLEKNDLSNSESLCCPYDSHQVSVQSDIWFTKSCLKNMTMAPMIAILPSGSVKFHVMKFQVNMYKE